MFGKWRKDPVLGEARKILLNHIETRSDGLLTVSENRDFRFRGTADGEWKVRVLGVKRKDYTYRIEANEKKAVQRMRDVMKNIGRRIVLKTDENVPACFVKTYIFHPMVFEFRKGEEDTFLLSAFSARTVGVSFAIWLVFKRFERELPESFKRIETKQQKQGGFLKKIRSVSRKKVKEKVRGGRNQVEKSGKEGESGYEHK